MTRTNGFLLQRLILCLASVHALTACGSESSGGADAAPIDAAVDAQPPSPCVAIDWAVTFPRASSSIGDDDARAILLGDGDLLVAAQWVDTALGSETVDGPVLARFDLSGNYISSTPLESLTTRVFMRRAGTSQVAVAGWEAARDDVLLARFGLDLGTVWSQVFSRLSNSTMLGGILAMPSGDTQIAMLTTATLSVGGGAIEPGLSIVHHDSSGAYVDHLFFDTASRPTSMETDGNGNLVVAGFGPADFGPTLGQETAHFIMKVDASGAELWRHMFVTDSLQSQTAQIKVGVRGDGHIVVASTFDLPVTVDGQTLVPDGTSVYMVGIDPGGTIQRVAQFRASGLSQLVVEPDGNHFLLIGNGGGLGFYFARIGWDLQPMCEGLFGADLEPALGEGLIHRGVGVALSADATAAYVVGAVRLRGVSGERLFLARVHLL